MITAVSLSPSLDVTYVVAALEGIQRPLEVHRMAGGKALNAARAAATMGADAAALTVLGGGTGTMVADGSVAAGVKLEVVAGSETTRTCVSISAQSDGGFTEIYERPTWVSPEAFEEVLARLPVMLAARPGWCLVSGGMPQGPGQGALARVVRVARAAGAHVAVDSHGPALRTVLDSEGTDLLKVNRAEATEALGVATERDLGEIVGLLRERIGGVVVVTDGTSGAVATDGSRTIRAVLPRVGAYPVGSGDSFLGGMLAALDRGDGLDAALALATACATANALTPGAAKFDGATARGLVGEVRLTDLG